MLFVKYEHCINGKDPGQILCGGTPYACEKKRTLYLLRLRINNSEHVALQRKYSFGSFIHKRRLEKLQDLWGECIIYKLRLSRV